ncbi:MAG: DNA mismatch repair endonuclease MutL, partial [Ruminiclostridium sp.]|nr:DNA mismatch repair endonuclease MutL [Ruminiclostridium sp.]
MIKLLDKSVYELIAAGEVIERPSSVIKELVENAVDAGAARITVEIKNGGITYMRVTDDGCGMAFDEVPTAFLRHATSKLSTAEELDSISTLGFRGEALASVAAVSRTEVLTKRQEDELGTLYHIEGGEDTLHEQSGCPDGTTVIMRDLFFNTPARLKFLKKDSTEGNYVQSVVDKLALSYPEISFSFIRDGKNVLLTSGDGKLYSAVYSVFGKQFAASLTDVNYEQNHIKVTGYVTTPYACRGNRQMQYFFVNGRWVRNTTCMAALEEGYKNSIMTGKFPACVLKIDMPSSDVDVN